MQSEQNLSRKQLILSVPTRWNSTYKMFKAFKEQKTVLLAIEAARRGFGTRDREVFEREINGFNCYFYNKTSQRLCALTSISNTLTRIAQMLHCIPSTSVSSERLFSKAGIIYSNDLRNRLSGKMVQKILIIKGNLNKVELAPLIDNEEEDVEEIDSDDE
uniref:HAT C-terminal dimerisation domain-containing protein n=1 Tax=Meloidogyne incognita TaxID=6306 RepID=A0A914LLA6_MELIC